MNIEELKAKGLYSCPVKLDNNQEKKFMPYSQYKANFLAEEPGELKIDKEKFDTFMLAWNSVIERKLAKKEDLSNLSLLDVRTKTGLFPQTMWDKFQMKSVHGIDMVKDWVDYAKSKGRPVGLEEDLTKLPCKANKYDIVYSFKTFGRVKDNQLFLKELCRVARKYIFLVIDDIARDSKLQYATTTDLRFYKQWLELDPEVIELTMAKNPVSKNPNDILVIIYKHGAENAQGKN